MSKQFPPKFKERAFTCPHCGVTASQGWHDIDANHKQLPLAESVFRSHCTHCRKTCIWINERMVLPENSGAPFPNEDMPPDVKAIYEEAGSILHRSPRGAVALLRYAVQILMPHIGGKGKKIDEDIRTLVQNGLPVEIQQTLDTLRLIGNDAVHPGTIDFDEEDSIQVATDLFDLLNITIEHQISQPKKVKAMYERTEQDKRDRIDKIDGKNKTP